MPIEIPESIADLIRNPARLRAAFELLKKMERLQIVTEDRKVFPIQFSDENAIFDLKPASALPPLSFDPPPEPEPEPEAETLAWESLVSAAGGTLAADSSGIANELVAQLKAAGLASKIVYLLPLLGSNLAAARCPLIDTLGKGAATNTGFADANFSQSTGLQLTGAALLGTGISPSELGASGAGGFGYWERSVAADPWVFGGRNSAVSEIYGLAIWTGDELFYYGHADGATRTFVPSGNNHYYGQRASATSRTLYRNGISVATDSDNPPVSGISSSPIYLGGLDASVFGSGRCGVAYLTGGALSDAEISSLHSILDAYLITPTGR